MLLSSTKFLCRYVHFLGDYRKRFGIESSYRQKDLYRICISTKNPVTRFPYVGIASTVCNTLNCLIPVLLFHAILRIQPLLITGWQF